MIAKSLPSFSAVILLSLVSIANRSLAEEPLVQEAAPKEERLMRILRDPQASFADRRRAAADLGFFGGFHGLMPLPGGLGLDDPLMRIANPTVAEAIVAAMDEELRAFDASLRPNTESSPPAARSRETAGERGNASETIPIQQQKKLTRDEIEFEYVTALRQVRDVRAAPIIARRAARSKRLISRIRLAVLAQDLRESKPLIDLANQLRAGELAFSPGESGALELLSAVWAMSNAGVSEADRALAALFDAEHPQHEAFAAEVRRDPLTSDSYFLGQRLPDVRYWDSRKTPYSQCWFAHLRCLAFLRKELDNQDPTIVQLSIEGDQLIERACDATGCLVSSGKIPGLLSNPADRREKTVKRRCDVAAEKLSRLVLGLPEYHALRKDADRRLVEYRTLMDRLAGRFRRLTPAEAEPFGPPSDPRYVADIRPLDRGATAEDVSAGRALFHFDGQGRKTCEHLASTAGHANGG